MRTKALFFGITLVFVILASSITVASIYTWKDEQGEVHYGDRVPPEYTTKATKLKNRSSAKRHQEETSSSTATLKKKLEDLNKTKSQETEKEKAAKNRLNENCTLAKSNLKTIQERARVRVKEKNGEYRILSHEEKNQKENKLKEQIKEFCVK